MNIFFNINLGRITILSSKLLYCFKTFETSSLQVEWRPISLQSSPGPFRAGPNLLGQTLIFPSPRTLHPWLQLLQVSPFPERALGFLFQSLCSLPLTTHPLLCLFSHPALPAKIFPGPDQISLPPKLKLKWLSLSSSATALFGICFYSIYHRLPFYIIVYFSWSWFTFDSSPIYSTWNRYSIKLYLILGLKFFNTNPYLFT